MRKIILLILALALFASCSSPVNGKDGTDGKDGTNGSNGKDGTTTTVNVTEKPNVHVVNSAWKIVYETSMSSRAIDSSDYIDQMVAEYNDAHTDDQWRIIYGDVPDISTAPKASASIVDASLAHIADFTDIPRSDLSTKRDSLRETAKEKSGTLYVDKTPPTPAPVHVVTDYERYALYLIAADGTIIAEEHLTADTFNDRVYQYQLQAQCDGKGEYVISGRLYP